MTDPADTTQQAASAEANGEQGAGATTDTGTVDVTALQAEVEKWKGLSRKHEAEAKTAKEQVRKFGQLESDTSTEKQILAETQDKLSKAELQLAKVNAAIKAGLDPKFANRLVGASEEELLEDAKSLIDVVGGKTPTAPPPAQFDGGPQGDAPQPPKDGNDWLRQTVEDRKGQGRTTLKL